MKYKQNLSTIKKIGLILLFPFVICLIPITAFLLCIILPSKLLFDFATNKKYERIKLIDIDDDINNRVCGKNCPAWKKDTTGKFGEMFGRCDTPEAERLFYFDYLGVWNNLITSEGRACVFRKK